MDSMTLQQAVEREILQKIVPNGKSFSFFDLAVKIRERVNSKEIDVTDCDEITVSGNKTRRITGDLVKRCAQTVLVVNHNSLSGYSRTIAQAQNGATYYVWNYTGIPTNPNVSQNSQAPVSPVSPVAPVAPVAPAQPVTPIVPQKQIDPNDPSLFIVEDN